MTKANKQAFSIPGYQARNQFIHPEGGLTKREYFAAMALPLVTSNEWIWDASGHESKEESIQEMAIIAVELADALIAELEKTK